jgi:hypothetical protein
MLILSFAALTLLLSTSWAYVNYLPATSVCGNFTVMGTDQCCPCSGACTTGPSYLSNWGWGCDDMGTGPVCPQDKVYYAGTKVQVPTAGQCCDSCDYECKWTNFQYTYKCCDCPTGYISSADTHNCRSLYCVGCSGPKETLIGDANTGFMCISSSSPSSSTSNSKSSTSSGSSTLSTATLVASKCKLNVAGEKFIKSFEKYSETFYDAGDGDDTIGKYVILHCSRVILIVKSPI